MLTFSNTNRGSKTWGHLPPTTHTPPPAQTALAPAPRPRTHHTPPRTPPPFPRTRQGPNPAHEGPQKDPVFAIPKPPSKTLTPSKGGSYATRQRNHQPTIRFPPRLQRQPRRPTP